MTRSSTALLIMDFQEGIADAAVGAGVLAAAMRARDAALRSSIRVVFSRLAFTEGYPEIGDDTPTFSKARAAGAFSSGKSRLLTALEIGRDQVIVEKKRFSAFTGSSLDVILRAHEVRSLVLAGVSTSGVVLSTLTQAFDLDYRLTVLADACLDPDAGVHELLMGKVFPNRAVVTGTDDWIATMERS